MKHKHYEMIVAKAANMELVVFVKTCDNGAWYEKGDNRACQWWEDSEYFLCLQQHKEACLHWLNGGDVQIMSFGWESMLNINAYPWESEHDFMDDSCDFRIKPKKEKRWIIVDPKTSYAFNELYETKIEADKENGRIHQVIEIEVEV